MDVGPTRSVWPSPGRPEPTQPAAPDALRPARDASRSMSNEAALTSSRGAPKGLEPANPVPRPDESHASGAPGQGTEARPEEPIQPAENVPEDMKPLMDRLAAPIRALIESDQLNEEAKRALAQALTQFDPSSEVPSVRTGPVDAQQRYEELEAAIDDFHESLKRIFRIGGDAVSNPPDALARDGADPTTRTEQQPTETVPRASDRASSSDALSARERLLLRIQAAYEPPFSGEQDSDQQSDIRSFSDITASDKKMYARSASMYTALYPTAMDGASSLNAEG